MVSQTAVVIAPLPVNSGGRKQSLSALGVATATDFDLLAQVQNSGSRRRFT
jgi:hypothetical protein